MKRYARPALAVVFVAMLATPAIIRRFGSRPAPAAAAADDAGAALRIPAHRSRRRPPASSSSTRRRRSTPSWRTSCRRWRRWAPRSPSPTSTPTATPISTSPTARKDRRTGSIAIAATARSRRSPSGSASPTSTSARPASRWARCSATTTTTASRICSSIAGAGPELFHNEQGRALHARHRRASLPAWANINTAVWLDFDRDGRLDLFLGGYYPERVESLEARRHEDHAGELRVREQRRPQVPLSQSRRRPVRGGQRAGRADLDALGAGGGRRGSARHRLSRSVHRQRLRRVRAVHQRGRPLPRGRPRGRRRLRAEERHERLGRRRPQPGQARDLRLEHLRGRHPAPGQQPVGADRRIERSCRPTRTWRARWASISAAGASARSSAI